MPAHWLERNHAAEAEVAPRRGDNPAWAAAKEESGAVGRLISTGAVGGHLLIVRRTR